jgi:hypothetical protein
MTDAERLAKIREWTQGEQSPAPVMTEYLDGFAGGYESAQESVLGILDAQPDPHPLGSVRFDEATEEQFKEFWEAAGFTSVEGWFERTVAGAPDDLTVYDDGKVSLWGGSAGIDEVFLGRFSTFQEAQEFLDKMAELLGGWA